MSDETKTKVHPLVSDWEAERAQIKKEQQQKEQDLLDSMGQHTEPDANGQEPGPPGQKVGAPDESKPPQDKGEPQK
jgi:hypothetical protein